MTASKFPKQIDLVEHLNQPETFLRTLDPTASEFLFQTFSDRPEMKTVREVYTPEQEGRIRNGEHGVKGKTVTTDPLAKVSHGTLAKLKISLAEANKKGAGVFVAVNEIDGSQRILANLSRYRAIFADMDAKSCENTSPDWPLPPSITVQSSPGNYQFYWLIDGEIDAAVYRGIGKRLVQDWEADKNAMDAVRVLRVPGFKHCKRDPVLVQLIEAPGHRYSAEQLAAAFPPVERVNSRQAHDPNAPTPDAGDLAAALDYLGTQIVPGNSDRTYADDRAEWVRFGIGIKRDLGDDGFSIWDAWSRTSDAYDAADAQRTWDSFRVDPDETSEVVHCASIFKLAHDAGYRPDRLARGDHLSLAAKKKLLKVQMKVAGKALGMVKKPDVTDIDPETGDEIESDFCPHDDDIPTLPAPTKTKGKGLAKSNGKSTVAVKITSDFPVLSDNGKPNPKAPKNVEWFLDKQGYALHLNDFDHEAYVSIGDQEPVPVTDAFVRNVKLQLDRLGMHASNEFVWDVILDEAESNKVHPVREYLGALVWDGTARLDKLLATYCGSDTSRLTSEIGKRWMIAGVRRIRVPGVKFDAMLTLSGKQGTGKSTFFSVLASPSYFNDSLSVGASAKDVIESTAGSWIVEIAELAKAGVRDVDEIKAFITRRQDIARTAYARKASKVQRQFILGATVNGKEFLRDEENRRFWVADAPAVDLIALTRDRDQLWAEAAYLEEQGEPHNIPADLWPEAAARNEGYGVADPIADHAYEILAGLGVDVVVSASSLALALGLRDVSKRGGQTAKAINRGATRAGWENKESRMHGVKSRRYHSPLSQPAAEPALREYDDTQRLWLEVRERSPMPRELGGIVIGGRSGRSVSVSLPS